MKNSVQIPSNIIIIIAIRMIEIFMQVTTFSVPNSTVINKGPVLKSIYIIDYEHDY